MNTSLAFMENRKNLLESLRRRDQDRKKVKVNKDLNNDVNEDVNEDVTEDVNEDIDKDVNEDFIQDVNEDVNEDIDEVVNEDIDEGVNEELGVEFFQKVYPKTEIINHQPWCPW